MSYDKLWLIWYLPREKIKFKVGSLTYCDDGNYKFRYNKQELDKAKSFGFTIFPGFNDVSRVYTSKFLFSNIKTRLPNISRPDYDEILKNYNLDRDSAEIDILKATRILMLRTLGCILTYGKNQTHNS